MHTVYFDLETGGLELSHPITQLAAVAINEKWEQVGRFQAKLQFDVKDADPQALLVNHYDAEIWRLEAKPPRLVAAAFSEWLGSYKDIPMTFQCTGKQYRVALLAGYNAATFDSPRLKKLFSDHQLFLPAHQRVLDVMQAVMWLDHISGSLESSYKLGDVCGRLGVDLKDAHDALADVRATIDVAKKVADAMVGGV